MKYIVEMGSGAMICISSFINIGSGIQKLIERDTQTHSQHADLISLLLFFFFKIRKVGYRLSHCFLHTDSYMDGQSDCNRRSERW
jgi:hypothetical protein